MSRNSGDASDARRQTDVAFLEATVNAAGFARDDDAIPDLEQVAQRHDDRDAMVDELVDSVRSQMGFGPGGTVIDPERR
jgi:hypothetical protein